MPVADMTASELAAAELDANAVGNYLLRLGRVCHLCENPKCEQFVYWSPSEEQYRRMLVPPGAVPVVAVLLCRRCQDRANWRQLLDRRIWRQYRQRHPSPERN